jgi:RimJ/RimL family protein N-acetyltransferase
LPAFPFGVPFHYNLAMQLATARLTLREFHPNDWEAVWRYQSHPDYLRYYAWEGRTPEEVQAFVQMFIGWQGVQPRLKYQLAVELGETGTLIGNCGIRREAAGATEADIGFEFDPAHWGKGYATEAARELVRFGFEELGLHRVWSWCIAENEASARVLMKAGLREEGRQRDKEFFKGRWWDVRLFGMARPHPPPPLPK